MLNKIYLKIHKGGLTYFYIESKNFVFGKTYDKDFNEIHIDKELFENSCRLIKQNVLTAEDTLLFDSYDIALGTPIKNMKKLVLKKNE